MAVGQGEAIQVVVQASVVANKRARSVLGPESKWKA
jgi:hypothetical protein